MKNVKNENGVIAFVTLLSMFFILVFLMSTYFIVSNRVKTQKDMLQQIKNIYETYDIDEAYNSYFNEGIIQIYSNDQYLSIGTKMGTNICIQEVGGKYYKFSDDATYVLMRDLVIKEEELPQNWEAPEYYFTKNKLSGKIDYNGHIVKIVDNNGEIVKEYGVIIKFTLPSEYVQLKYIESTGTQYIDLNLTTSIDTKFTVDYAVTKYSGAIIGSYANTYQGYTLITNSAGELQFRGYANTIGKTGVVLPTNTRYTDTLSYGNLIHASNEYKGTADYSGSELTNTYLFARLNNGNFDLFSSIKLYGCKIYEDEILVRDLIPCYRKADNEIGMYDMVEGIFYTNSGTGEFKCEISKNYQMVEYLQTSGGSIDTGLYITDKYQIEMKAKFDNHASSEDWLFGDWNSGPVRGELIGYYRDKIRVYSGPDNSNYYLEINRDTNVHTYKILKDSLYIDDLTSETKKPSFTELGNMTKRTLKIFKANHYNSSSTKKIYYAKIWDLNDNLVRDFIPCYRKTDEVAGMYDLVENKFYTGTGTFICGPEVE